MTHVLGAELDHDRVGVAVDDLGVKLVAVGEREALLDQLQKNR